MKCTSKSTHIELADLNNRNKKPVYLSCLAACLAVCIVLSGCGQSQFNLPYSPDSDVSSFRVVNLTDDKPTANPFAADLCVVSSDILQDDLDMLAASGVGLFDLNNKQTIYAKNVHEKLYPASLTKVMTALVALKKGSGDMLLTATANVKIQEPGAQLCGIKEGDQMTLTQALHIMLINSANDAAVMIAEGIAGSVEEFSDMMNEEALALGATNTHFVNPHGLSDDNHYTSVYDMYLITNEAVKYEMFREIINMDSYSMVYTNKEGKTKDLDVKNTNFYLHGTAQPPSGVTVLGGKTGTTNAAGHCLILYSKDTTGSPYISIIMRSDSRDDLYIQMTDLLTEIK